MDFQYNLDHRSVCAVSFDFASNPISGVAMPGGGILQLHLNAETKELSRDRPRPYLLFWHAAKLNGPGGDLPAMKPHSQPLALLDHNATQRVLLPFELTTQQALALDATRDDHGLFLHLFVWALAEGPAGLQMLHAQGHLPVSNATWVEVMKGMRLAERALIECTLTAPDVHPKFGPASNHMREALKFLHQHQWKQAVAEARDVFKALEENGLRDMKSEQDTAQRLEVMLGAVRHATHAGHHEPEIGKVSPEQAKAIVRSAAVIFDHLVQAG